jgi:hypothetical protein
MHLNYKHPERQVDYWRAKERWYKTLKLHKEKEGKRKGK